MKKDTQYYARIAKRAIEKITLLESAENRKSKYKITINNKDKGAVPASNAREAILNYLKDNKDIAEEIGSLNTIKSEDKIKSRSKWAEVACKNGTARAEKI